MDTERLRTLANEYKRVGVGGLFKWDEAMELCRLALEAAAALEQPALVVAVPDDVREALRMAIETRKSALYGEIPDLRQASIDKYKPYLDEMDMASAWLDQQARPQPPQE